MGLVLHILLNVMIRAAFNEGTLGGVRHKFEIEFLTKY
jgi:hypothetical protein